MGLLDDHNELDLEKTARGVLDFARAHLPGSKLAKIEQRLRNDGWSVSKALEEAGILFCRTKVEIPARVFLKVWSEV